jgi:hypothetical protein
MAPQPHPPFSRPSESNSIVDSMSRAQNRRSYFDTYGHPASRPGPYAPTPTISMEAPAHLAYNQQGVSPTTTDMDVGFPPSVSQCSPRDNSTAGPSRRAIPTISVDDRAVPGILASDTTRTLRKQRSRERTRTWAEEVERQRLWASRADSHRDESIVRTSDDLPGSVVDGMLR